MEKNELGLANKVIAADIYNKSDLALSDQHARNGAALKGRASVPGALISVLDRFEKSIGQLAEEIKVEAVLYTRENPNN